MLNARPIPPTVVRRGTHSLLKRLPAPVPESGNGTASPVLHCLPLQRRGRYLQFQPFDAAYVSRLRAGDFRTQEHFCAYFTAIIRIKVSSRVRLPQIVEDVRQETFARFFKALHAGDIQYPERLGSYVLGMCRNILSEQYRSDGRMTPIDGEDEQKFPAPGMNLVDSLLAKENEEMVREILETLSDRDRRVLRAVFLEERDKDEVCREFGVDREYLRVLLYRAKQAFKTSYLKRMGENSPEFAPSKKRVGVMGR
ncbi:MAG TPA: sigma-70 family RNA polymerase sigma factor [Candidatus Sulfotelmatobacter sp.]